MDRARGPVGPPVPKRLRATTAAELGEIEGLIHDAYFDPEALAFDEQEHTLTVPFSQEDHDWRGDEPPWEPLGRSWWYEEHRVPFYEGRLTIHHVTAVELPPDFSDIWMLVYIRYDEVRRRVLLDALVKIHASVERLEVTAELTDRVVKDIRRRSYRFFHGERDQIM